VTFRMAATTGALAGLINIVVLVSPDQFAAFHGITLDPISTALARLLGVAYLSLAVLNWGARAMTEPSGQRVIALANVLAWGVSLIVSLAAQGAGTGANATAWIWVVMQAVFTAIWGSTLVIARLLSGQRAS
jgi:hypothetical protein